MVNLLAQSTASSLYVVVGGSRGIGLAMAEALLRRTSGSVLAASRAARHAFQKNNETKKNRKAPT